MVMARRTEPNDSGLYFRAVELAFVAFVCVAGSRDEVMPRQKTHFAAAKFALFGSAHARLALYPGGGPSPRKASLTGGFPASTLVA